MLLGSKPAIYIISLDYTRNNQFLSCINHCYFGSFFFIFFMAVLGLHFCARAFSSCGKWGPLFIVVRRPLTIAASPILEHRLQTRRLSNCGSRAQLLRGMWDPPRPGLEPMSPALAGRLSTTAPPGKPLVWIFYGLNCVFPSNSYVEVLTPSTSECDLIWRYSLY